MSFVTVCICIRDGEQWIDRCFESLFPQLDALETELIVVNHRSVDATQALLDNWQGKRKFTCLSYEHEGLAAVRDFAWRKATTAWVAFIDIDCRASNNWLRTLTLAAVDATPETAAFGGRNTVPMEQGYLYDVYSVLLSTYVGGHSSILNRTFSRVHEVDHAPTLNVVYRCSFLERINGFDPDFTRVGEDIDLSYRLRKDGKKIWALPDMVVEHGLRPSLVQWFRNMALYGRGRIFFLKKNFGAFHIKYIIPAATVVAYILAVGVDGRIAVGLLAAHFLVLGSATMRASFRKDHGWRVWIMSSAVGWATHISYGLGSLREMIRRRSPL